MFHDLLTTVSDQKCGIEGAIYDESNGRCQCGDVDDCAGQMNEASYCDAESNACRCSDAAEGCTNPRSICTQGVCKCGAAETCNMDSKCDAPNNMCIGEHQTTF